MPTHNLHDVEQLLDVVGIQHDEAAETKMASSLTETIREEAHQMMLDDVMPGRAPAHVVSLEEASALYPDASSEASDDALLETRAKQGDPNWHRRSPIEKAMVKQRLRFQLEQQKRARETQQALERWRNTPNPNRVTLEEIREAGEASGNRLGQARFNLAIRAALRQQGYVLGMQ